MIKVYYSCKSIIKTIVFGVFVDVKIIIKLTIIRGFFILMLKVLNLLISVRISHSVLIDTSNFHKSHKNRSGQTLWGEKCLFNSNNQTEFTYEI